MSATETEYLSCADTAKMLRQALKAGFPGVKFSIKSRRFAGGDAIDVSWIDGPVSKQVDEIIDRYSAGDFNGMEDLYEYRRDYWIKAFGARSAHARRSSRTSTPRSARSTRAPRRARTCRTWR